MRCWLCFLVAGLAAALLWSNPAEAQARKRRPAIRAKAVKAPKGRAARRHRAKARAAAVKPVDPAASGPVVSAEGGVKAKLYNFNAMDIDGKLKAPQLMYFLNRVKGEFDESALDRRSFLPELKRTSADPNL